jgi:hypothetical protein
MSDKILVTSRSALIEKYGKKGFDDIIGAVQALARADEDRGYVTRLIFLDDQKTMRRFRGTAVTDIKSGQQHKTLRLSPNISSFLMGRTWCHMCR